MLIATPAAQISYHEVIIDFEAEAIWTSSWQSWGLQSAKMFHEIQSAQRTRALLSLNKIADGDNSRG